MAVAWTITHPSGTGTAALADLGIASTRMTFLVMGTSTASLTVNRNFDSGDLWWAADSLVTIYRDGAPYFTGRVQESPRNASGSRESRVLSLADAWDDLETTIYQEKWNIGSGNVYYPRCILGLNSAGASITSGAQIGAVIDYAMSCGVSLTKGTIDTGLSLWPSQVENTSCESVIVEELRFHPNWVARLDHSTNPPVFSARTKSAFGTVTIDIADETVDSFSSAKVERNVPLGVRIVYNSASNIDGKPYRDAYLDTAGVTTNPDDETGETPGRRVMQAMLDLKGLTMQFQKSRVQTRTLPTGNSGMTAYFKKKWPELKDMPDSAFEFTNFAAVLADEETHPDPVNPKAERLSVTGVSDVPRELVSGTIEDWMRVKVRRVAITYDLKIIGSPSAAQKKILDNFSGTGKSFSVIATDATTKIYKGISNYDEGESKPTGIAASVFAAATADQYEGSVTIVGEDVPASTYHGKTLILENGTDTVMPGSVIYSATVDVESGTMTLDFGPMPYLSAGDFLELQRMFTRRKACWMSAAERSSNQLGADAEPGSKGDTVAGYDYPQTITSPGGGGGGTSIIPFKLTTSKDGETLQWRVEYEYASITDGANGDAIDLSTAGFDADNTITATKYIVLKATVGTDLAVSDWALAAVDAADAEEVGFDSSTPPVQDEIRLLIGKVTVASGEATAAQAVFSQQRIVHGFVNGSLCKVFSAAPMHPDDL